MSGDYQRGVMSNHQPIMNFPELVLVLCHYTDFQNVVQALLYHFSKARMFSISKGISEGQCRLQLMKHNGTDEIRDYTLCGN